MTLRCYLYEAFSSRRREILLERRGEDLVIIDPETGETEEIEVHRVEAPVASHPRSIALNDGRSIEPLEPIPPGLLAERRNGLQSWIVWWERFTLPKAFFLIVALVSCVAGLRAALPYAADAATVFVPHSLETAMGEEAFDQVEEVLQMGDSELPVEEQARLRNLILDLGKQAGLERSPAVEFRKGGPLIGANALAFPGGPLVITDEIVELFDDDALLLGVAAHELAHVEERHGLRQVARVTSTLIVISFILGADTSGLEEFSGVVLQLASSGYSREFESDAYQKGAEILRAAGKSPEDLAVALEVLTDHCGAGCEESGFFSSHPGGQERIEALRALP
jgi:Zn-dependent protease with chaperone function